MICDITDNEKTIIDFIREARPFEKLTIIKDRNGLPDTYVIQREQKIIIGI